MPRLRFGLPMWSNNNWPGRFYAADARSGDFLRQYAGVFDTVEGNTTFYAIPSEASVQAWAQAVPAGFRFSFKMPKMITHDLKLQRCDEALHAFMDRMQPLHGKMGPVMIQLPPAFDGTALPLLAQFVKKLPAMYRYSVEVRHPDFFNNSEAQQQLHDLLARYRMERVCFDCRALFSADDNSTATLEAQRKKPNLPLFEVPVIKTPMLRFVGHPVITENADFFAVWVEKIAQWLAAGKEPYIFMHMGDNSEAPALARELYSQVQARLPELPDLPDFPVNRQGSDGQISLF